MPRFSRIFPQNRGIFLRRFLRVGLLLLLMGCLVAAGLHFWGIHALGRVLFPQVADTLAATQTGGVLLDRNEEILRLFPDQRGDFSRPYDLASFPRILQQAFLAAEDKRFYEHRGYDPIAILRAAWQNVSRQQVVSGASTISQQVIRIGFPGPRTIRNKIRETLMAVSLEQHRSKAEILTQYLNSVPMGGNMRGVGLASLIYLRKSPGALTLAEAAFLAAIPQAPIRAQFQSGLHWKKLLLRRNAILRNMRALGFIAADEETRARQQELKYRKHLLPFRAPHFVDWVVAAQGAPKGRQVASIDLSVQSALEDVLSAHQDRLDRGGARQAAGLVVRTRTMEVLGMAGSFAYSSRFAGFNNGCLAPRSGGSILKPFLYALALDQGYAASSVISDTKRTFQSIQGDYLPFNSNRRSYGPVTLRTALGNSLNLSAVKMLNLLGIPEFFEVLVELGLLTDDPKGPAHFGLGLAIGNPEIRMVDLAAAYGSLAHFGRRVSLRTDPGPLQQGERLFSPQACFLILDILSDASARVLTFGNPPYFKFPVPVGIKTGTSTNYRDSWLVAVHPEFLLLFWVGNFDGSRTFGQFGSNACGPMFHDVFAALGLDKNYRWFPRPPGIIEHPICGISGQMPTEFCRKTSQDLFIAGYPLPASCTFHTGDSDRHTLDPEYSNWLYQRQQMSVADPFQLVGNTGFIDPFSTSGLLSGKSGSVQFLHLPTPATATRIMPQTAAATSARLIVSSPPLTSVGFGQIRIVSPHDGDRLMMAPGEENLIALRAIPDEPFAEILWLVDGRELSRTPPPYETYWQLQRGRHTITAIGPSEEAGQITVMVE